jgi:hypothetical protein
VIPFQISNRYAAMMPCSVRIRIDDAAIRAASKIPFPHGMARFVPPRFGAEA